MRLRSTLPILLLLTIFSQNTKAQDLAAYVDFKNYFYVFDDGSRIQLSHQAVQSYKVGYNTVAYLNNQSDLWVYQNGKQKLLSETIRTYNVSDHLMTFGDNGFLNIYDNGRAQMLSNNVASYKAGDSLVAYYDKLSESFEVYYNNESIQLESGLVDGEIRLYKVGDNILAYFDKQGYFKVFYQGEAWSVLVFDDFFTFEVGLNVVAYAHPDFETLNVIYKGEEIELENAMPQNFKCGDDMVAYVTLSGEFRQFYQGKTTEISSFEPDFYEVIDDMLVYSLQGRFYVYHNGKSTELANFTPKNYQVDRGALAFLDQQGKLWMYRDGKVSMISTQRVTEFQLVGNTLQYNLPVNEQKIKYKGRTY